MDKKILKYTKDREFSWTGPRPELDNLAITRLGAEKIEFEIQFLEK